MGKCHTSRIYSASETTHIEIWQARRFVTAIFESTATHTRTHDRATSHWMKPTQLVLFEWKRRGIRNQLDRLAISRVHESGRYWIVDDTFLSHAYIIHFHVCVYNMKHSRERRTKCIIYVAFNKSRERGRLGSPPGAPNKDKTKAFSKWSDTRMYAPMIYGAASNTAVLSGSKRTLDFVRKQLSDDASKVEPVPTFLKLDWFFRWFLRNW